MPTVLKTYGCSRSNRARVCPAFQNYAPLGSSDTSPSRELTDWSPDCGVLQDRALAHVLLKCQRYRSWWNCCGYFEFPQRVSTCCNLYPLLTENEGCSDSRELPYDGGPEPSGPTTFRGHLLRAFVSRLPLCDVERSTHTALYSVRAEGGKKELEDTSLGDAATPQPQQFDHRMMSDN